ncbi:MAG: calcium-binding protein [Symploca sp. SIO2E6]|nr:calcium-binding protein [Symploca sp. SIO2E6]
MADVTLSPTNRGFTFSYKEQTAYIDLDGRTEEHRAFLRKPELDIWEEFYGQTALDVALKLKKYIDSHPQLSRDTDNPVYRSSSTLRHRPATSNHFIRTMDIISDGIVALMDRVPHLSETGEFARTENSDRLSQNQLLDKEISAFSHKKPGFLTQLTANNSSDALLKVNSGSNNPPDGNPRDNPPDNNPGDYILDSNNSQTKFVENIDIINAEDNHVSVFPENTVAFFNELDNHTQGFNNSDDVINAQVGNDTLTGHGGDDLLRVGIGNDILLGDSSNDYLVGDTEDDLLNGGAGNNQLIFGSSSDIFFWSRKESVNIISDNSHDNYGNDNPPDHNSGDDNPPDNEGEDNNPGDNILDSDEVTIYSKMLV